MKMTNFVKLFLSICFLFYLTTNAQVMKNNIDPTTGLPVTITEPPQGNTLLSASGGNVLWDLTHGIYWGYEPANRYSNLVTALQAAGYTISTTTDFAGANLSNIKVLVICLGSAWNSAYTSAEISKIQTFVQNGGGLLILGDNAVTTPNVNIKPIAQAFGVTLGVSSIFPASVLVTNFTAHSIFNGVSELYIQVGGEITATSPATIMAREPGNKGIIAVAQSGSGRVVAVGDINYCENAYIDSTNNRIFAVNVFDWLSNSFGKFDFNDGTTQGWIKEGAFDENGAGPFFNNFSFAWYDYVNYPNAAGKDPTGDQKGALTLYTWSGHGVANPNTSAKYWIMRYKSPDLSGSSTWQTAKGYTAEIAECFASTGEFFANLFVIVYDKDQAKDRYFYNGTAVKLTHDVYNDNNATWNHLTFDWSGISTFPTNFTIKNIFVNLWGRMSAVLGQGGTYLDEVVPILPAPVPDIASIPIAGSYNSVNIGSFSDIPFVIRNEGTGILNVASTTLTGSFASEFSIQSGGGAFTLAPAATREVIVRFSPASAGFKAASLSISCNDPDENPFLVLLSGTGVVPSVPDIASNPKSWSFGGIDIGSYADKTFVISNEGNATLNVTATVLAGPYPAEYSLQSGGGAFTLAPAATRNIIVRFSPTNTGDRNAILNISSNDPDENPFQIQLGGSGTAPSVPDITPLPISLDFGTVMVGGWQEKLLTVKNDGAGTLNVTATTLTGANASQFAIQSGGGAFSLTTGASRNMVLRFTPTTSGNKTASLSISSNDPDENPLLVNLVGSGAGAGVPILPTITNPLQMAGTEFIINIEVGTVSKPVTDLFGVSFKLNYTNTIYINYVSAEPGPFIGSDVIFFPTADDPNGKLSIGLSRKSGQGGVNGFGSITEIKFTTVLTTPHNTAVDFSITDVAANNSAGDPINLTPGLLKINIQSGVLVWPGDTNNNGKVDQADILPLGLHWERTGPPRQGASTMWTGQLATPWTPQAATFADANGDGVVNQTDVLPIGLNWNKTHTLHLLTTKIPLPPNFEKASASQLAIKITGNTDPNQDFFIDIIGNNLANVLGLSFELVNTPVSLADLQSVEIGLENILGTDPIFFPMINKTFGVDSGKVSVGISRKFNEGGITGSGLITRIVAHMSAGAIPNVSQTMITFQNVLANDPTGNPIVLEVVPYTLITHVNNSVPELPSDFVLYDNYPNPFNPGTTISFSCPQLSDVTLTIYDLQGQKVRQLVRGEMAAGLHKAYWNSQNEQGKVVAAGIYFYQIEAKLLSSGQRHVMVKKMTLMK